MAVKKSAKRKTPKKPTLRKAETRSTKLNRRSKLPKRRNFSKQVKKTKIELPKKIYYHRSKTMKILEQWKGKKGSWPTDKHGRKVIIRDKVGNPLLYPAKTVYVKDGKKLREIRDASKKPRDSKGRISKLVTKTGKPIKLTKKQVKTVFSKTGKLRVKRARKSNFAERSHTAKSVPTIKNMRKILREYNRQGMRVGYVIVEGIDNDGKRIVRSIPSVSIDADDVDNVMDEISDLMSEYGYAKLTELRVIGFSRKGRK